MLPGTEPDVYVTDAETTVCHAALSVRMPDCSADTGTVTALFWIATVSTWVADHGGDDAAVLDKGIAHVDADRAPSCRSASLVS